MLKASFNVCFFFLLRTVDCSSISKTLIFSAIYSCGDFCFSQLNIGARDRRESFFVQDRQMEMAIQTQTSILSQKNEIEAAGGSWNPKKSTSGIDSFSSCEAIQNHLH